MSSRSGGIRRVRLVIGTAGCLLAAFGVLRLVTEIPASHLLTLAVWLVGALVLHDAVLSPAVVALGAGLRRVPARARAYLQAALVAGGIVTVVALPLIYRARTQPRVKAILDQNYLTNLATLLAVITGAAVLSYLRRLWGERRARTASRAADDLPPHDSGSMTG